MVARFDPYLEAKWLSNQSQMPRGPTGIDRQMLSVAATSQVGRRDVRTKWSKSLKSALFSLPDTAYAGRLQGVQNIVTGVRNWYFGKLVQVVQRLDIRLSTG